PAQQTAPAAKAATAAASDGKTDGKSDGKSDGKAQRLREHEQRQQRAQEKKLAGEVAPIEKEIATPQAAQAERSAQLADPAVYADKPRSQTLIEDFRKAQVE